MTSLTLAGGVGGADSAVTVRDCPWIVTVVLALRLNCTLPSELLRVVALLRTPPEPTLNEPAEPSTVVLMVTGVAGG